MKNTITNKDVESFLTDLNIKMSVFGIIFRDDRGKNMQTLLDLEITPKTREDIIKTLTPDDYIVGPSLIHFIITAKCGFLAKTLKGMRYT